MKLVTTVVIFILFGFTVFSQTQNDTIYNYKTQTPVIIDGQATEECWTTAKWHNIDQVWIPYNATMKDGDFQGRFKVSWDENYLYVLVEVVDDSLSDDHSNPLQSWWDDDCLELFIDENRSMGDHERNCNAFAYHVSLFYDAIDLNSTGQGINYKNNIEVDMDTIGTNTYLWELAIKNYSASFSIYNPEASRVYLSPNKLMGFAIAYCDNDETTARENFIGSMVMPAAHNNDMYKNADYFGPMLLLDTVSVNTKIEDYYEQHFVKLYPNPATERITIELPGNNASAKSASIINIAGQLVYHEIFMENKQIINIEELNSGIYMIRINDGNTTFTKRLIKH